MGSVELVKAGAEVLEPGQSTARELAERANREHELVLEAAGEMIVHAIAAGEILNQAREILSRKDWADWVENEFQGSRASASIYMRVARYQAHVSRDMSISQAYMAVKGLPPVAPRGGGRPMDTVDIADAEALRAEGKSYGVIGATLGFSHNTVRRYLDPSARQYDLRRHQRRLAAERVLHEQERERKTRRAVRKAGGARAEAYAMAERMQDVLGQAHRETDDRASREAWSLAGEHYRKMRDEIVRALGVS